MVERGMKVEFLPDVLLKIFTDLETDEHRIRDRFKKGSYCEVYPVKPEPDAKYAIFQNSDRIFLFKCVRKDDENTWKVIAIEETHAGAWHSGILIPGTCIHHARRARIVYERTWGIGTGRTRCKVRIVATQFKNNKILLKACQIGTISIEEGVSFVGSWIDFLKRFIPRNKLDKLNGVKYPEGAKVSIELRVRGMQEPLRVIPIFE